MVDLGLFNFVKNAIAEGKSKDEIKIALAKGGWKEADMEEAYAAVENDTPPAVASREAGRNILIPKADAREIHRPTLVTMFCGYFFISFALTVANMGLMSLSGQLPLSVSLDMVPLIVITLVTIVSMFGYWGMRRWGVMLYTLNTVALVLYVLSQFHTFTLFPVLTLILQTFALPLATVYIGFAYFDEMS